MPRTRAQHPHSDDADLWNQTLESEALLAAAEGLEGTEVNSRAANNINVSKYYYIVGPFSIDVLKLDYF